MPTHFIHAIDGLKEKLLNIGAKVEEALRGAVRCVANRDATLGAAVYAGDDEIDALEVDVEEECLHLLALYQPVAADLRFIVAALKINNDLERVGDLAVNVAERGTFLASQRPPQAAFDFHHMAGLAQSMLTRALDAFVNVDTRLAYEVIAADDEVDAENRQVYICVQDAIRKYPEDLESLIHLLSISRHLERIADLATNIAEDVVYMAKGEIIRHGIEEYRPLSGSETGRSSSGPGSGG